MCGHFQSLESKIRSRREEFGDSICMLDGILFFPSSFLPDFF